MYSISDIKTGTKIDISGTPYEVVSYQHKKLGRGGAIAVVKLKNLIGPGQIEKTFKGKDAISPARLETFSAQYLYHEGNNFVFMKNDNFEQFNLDTKQLSGKERFVKEGDTVSVVTYKGKPVTIDLPIKIDMKIAKTDPGLRGDTKSSSVKPAETETGLLVQVPLFINEGDIIRVDRRTCSYVERVN